MGDKLPEPQLALPAALPSPTPAVTASLTHPPLHLGVGGCEDLRCTAQPAHLRPLSRAAQTHWHGEHPRRPPGSRQSARRSGLNSTPDSTCIAAATAPRPRESRDPGELARGRLGVVVLTPAPSHGPGHAHHGGDPHTQSLGAGCSDEMSPKSPAGPAIDLALAISMKVFTTFSF